MRVFERILYGIVGALLAIGLISAVIGIASAVNKIDYREQIADWFGPQTVVEEDGTIDGEETDVTDDEQAEDETSGTDNEQLEN